MGGGLLFLEITIINKFMAILNTADKFYIEVVDIDPIFKVNARIRVLPFNMQRYFTMFFFHLRICK